MEKIKEVNFTNEYGLKDTWTYEGNRLIKTEFRYPRINKKKKINSQMLLNLPIFYKLATFKK